MKLFATALGFLIFAGTQSFANKTIHVFNKTAAPLYEALASTPGMTPVNGVIDLNGINCVTTRTAERGDPKAKWEYISQFSCDFDSSPSYNSRDPVTGTKAQAIITALNRAGLHSYSSKSSTHISVKSVFIQSLSCERSEQKQQDEGDLMFGSSALYACSVEI